MASECLRSGKDCFYIGDAGVWMSLPIRKNAMKKLISAVCATLAGLASSEGSPFTMSVEPANLSGTFD